MLAKLMGWVLLAIVRVLTGAQARWHGAPPKAEQRIYFANHQSHADLVMIWAALPQELRSITRPIAAKDYWTKTPFRKWITSAVFNAVYVDRERKDDADPLQPLADALRSGDSIILFPEGTRGSGRLDRQHPARHAQGRGGTGADPVLRHLRRAAGGGTRRGPARVPRPRARRGDRAARRLNTA
jgi:1-acyl-sn-glycerol-3-phosphate acyltransferase